MVFDVSSIWIIAISVGIILAIMVSSVFAYFCGCCKKIPSRDELIGLSGVVKITNPDSDHCNGSVSISLIRTPSDDNVPIASIASRSASAKRLNGVANNACNPGTATRSLPEIPVGATISKSNRKCDEVDGDFAGYTGVSDTNSDLYATLEEHEFGAAIVKSKLPPSGVSYDLSVPSTSTTRTYEQIDEDPPYNKVKAEHPYAQVENDTDSSTYGIEPSVLERRILSNVDEVDGPVNIPAASAIAGSVAASSELPYMTPPIHTDHFSGDSQDSTKGYTSITVREPLARIRQKADVNDSHYTVLSDDSEDLYAAIQEIYTSESETYAQIQPPPTINPIPNTVPETINETPSSQKFCSSNVHSRQASTSSVASSLTNRNSPKEKRQANSPLPKPPDLTTDDMYAKVLKKRRSEIDRNSSRDSVYHSDLDSVSSLNSHCTPFFPEIPDQNVEEIEGRLGHEEDDDAERFACGYETLPERNYEVLLEDISCPGYETLKENQNSVGYESLPDPDSLTPGYERIRDLNGGYEKIKYNKEEESDPNYEELKPQADNDQFHCYATINKGNKKSMTEQAGEPDYASLIKYEGQNLEYDNNIEDDPFYERIRKRRPSNSKSNENGANSKVKFNDNNNNHSESSKLNEPPNNQPLSQVNLNELYSKVNKNIKR